MPAGGRLVAVVPDLMDRSRVAAARPDVVFLARPADLAGLDPADVALVDLGRPGVLAAIGGCRATVIGFVAHVDHDRAAEAAGAGVQQVLARSAFFRRLGTAV